MPKLNIKKMWGSKNLVIFDIDRIAPIDYIPLVGGQYRNREPMTTILNNRLINTSIFYGVFNRMANFNWEHSDFLFAFDTKPGHLNWFKKLYANGYTPTDHDYYSQISGLRPILKECNFTVLEQDGYEAYNLILKAVEDNAKYYDNVIIYTKDKYLYHLVDERVSIVLIGNRKDDLMVHTYENVLNVPYNLYNLYLCTVGDTTIDMKGIKGFGKAAFEKMLIKDEILMEPVDVSTIDLIETSTYLKENQKYDALEFVQWLSMRPGTRVDTRPKKGNKDLFSNYLSMFEMHGTLRKLRL